MTETDHRLLYALACMCNQYLTNPEDPNDLDHICMHAGEWATDVLFEHGLISPHFRGGTWTEAGKRLLASRPPELSPSLANALLRDPPDWPPPTTAP